jgi:3-deoxy-D-arabino-heptulosonate 7-phosphate (DAHP) synthase
VRIRSINALLPPICLIEELPCEAHHLDTITEGREALQKVFDGQVRATLLADP